MTVDATRSSVARKPAPPVVDEDDEDDDEFAGAAIALLTIGLVCLVAIVIGVVVYRGCASGPAKPGRGGASSSNAGGNEFTDVRPSQNPPTAAAGFRE